MYSESITVSYNSFLGSIGGILLFLVLTALPVLAVACRDRIYTDAHSPLVQLLYTCFTWALFALYGAPLFILARILYRGITLPTHTFNDTIYSNYGLTITRKLNSAELNKVVETMLNSLRSKYSEHAYSINLEKANIMKAYEEGNFRGNEVLGEISARFADLTTKIARGAELRANQKDPTALEDAFTFISNHPQFSAAIAVISTIIAFGLFLMHCRYNNHATALNVCNRASVEQLSNLDVNTLKNADNTLGPVDEALLFLFGLG